MITKYRINTSNYSRYNYNISKESKHSKRNEVTSKEYLYQYIKNYHAELLDVVNNDTASAAVGYAGFLAKSEDKLHKIYDISKWLRTQKIQLNNGRMKRRIAFFLLLRFPKVFFYSVKILLPLGLVKR